MKRISDAALNIDGQPMFKILDKVKKLESKFGNYIHLEIGDPHHQTPPNIISAAIKSITNNETHYCSSYGLQEFRTEIITRTAMSRNFSPDLNQILVTPSANISIFYAVYCLVNPGDEVIVPDPGFPTYYSVIKMCGAKEVRVPLRPENQFKMSPKDIEDRITDKTRLIIINSPSNPTGAIIPAKDIEEIYKIAKKYDLYLFSDEIYARMQYTLPFISPGLFDRCKERVIVSNGFSKSFSMTGWRLGTIIGPEDVIERMAMLLQTTASCVSPFIQKAGLEALRGGDYYVRQMLDDYSKKRDLVIQTIEELSDHGLKMLNPEGTFYAWVDIRDIGFTSDEFCDYLLKYHVVVLPGNCFGENGEGFIRISFAPEYMIVHDGMRQIKRAVQFIRKYGRDYIIKELKEKDRSYNSRTHNVLF